MEELSVVITPIDTGPIEEGGSSVWAVQLVFTQGQLTQGIQLMVPPDVQDAVAVCDYFYQQLLQSFSIAGQKNWPASMVVEGELVEDD
jgi:hypothetical protein